MAITLYPPIIDNTISAFTINSYDGCEIIFTLQNSSEEIDSQYIILRMTDSLGNSVLAAGEYGRFTYEKYDLGLIGESTETRYRTQIFAHNLKTTDNIKSQFTINSRYQIQLYTIAPKAEGGFDIEAVSNLDLWMNDSDKNALHSVASDTIVKYAIAQPNFELYQVKNKTEELLGDTVAPSKLTLKGYLKFDDNNETDNIQYYYLSLKQKKTGENDWKSLVAATEKLFPEQDSFGNRYILFKADSPLNAEEQYHLQITYVTLKGYLEIKTYKFEVKDLESKLDNIAFTSLNITKDKRRAANTISVQLQNKSDESKGILALYRSEYLVTNSWEESLIFEKELTLQAGTDDAPSVAEVILHDVTIEAGKVYQYRAIYYTEDNDSIIYASNEASTKETGYVMIFDDIYLVTKEMSIRLAFNPEIDSVKRNVVDVVTPTLGGKYPFVRRNGKQVYKTFNLKGLISIEALRPENDYIYEEIADSMNPTKDSDSFEFEIDQLYSLTSVNFNVRQEALETVLKKYKETLDDPYNYKVVTEKIFRDKVVEFLYEPSVKLFKSMQEGNMFVYLTNIQLTPDKTLGRNIYNFSCQAVEVEEANGENYRKYFSYNEDQETYVWRNLYLYSKGFGDDGILQLEAAESGANVGIHTDGSTYTLVLVKKDTTIVE